MASIYLNSSKLSIKTKSASDKYSTITLDGLSNTATADNLLNISDAIGSLTDGVVSKTSRIDESIVTRD